MLGDITGLPSYRFVDLHNLCELNVIIKTNVTIKDGGDKYSLSSCICAELNVIIKRNGTIKDGRGRERQRREASRRTTPRGEKEEKDKAGSTN